MDRGLGRPTEAVIDLRALRHNAGEVRRLAGGRAVMAVVKADAYGHGAVPVARCLLDAGCEQLAVVSVAEAEVLRRASIEAPLLILGGVHDPAEAAAAIELDCAVTVHDAEAAARLRTAAGEAGRLTRVHLEVDSGMRRMGTAAEAALPIVEALAADSHIALEGVFTHLACADDPDPAESLEQLGRFAKFLAAARGAGADPAFVHFANSAALLTGGALERALPESNLVRPGLMLYGACPAPHLEERASLRPVMEFVAGVVALRDAKAGDPVGYGGDFRAPADTRIATLSAGYADGVPRSLAGRGEVSIRGKRHPIAGRVSMDYTGVDIGASPLALGDEAVIFGSALPVEEAGRAAGTVHYEMLTGVGPRVPRRYLDEGEPEGAGTFGAGT